MDYRGKTPTKLDEGVRLITAKNVRKGAINLSPEEFLSEKDYHAWMTRGFPKVGDVLFTTEAPMGNAAVVQLDGRFALAQRVICFQSYGAIESLFLVLLILTTQFQFILDKNGTGVTAKGIKASKLKQLPIAVPPLAEQKRIVAKVDELMALCDRLEAQQQQRDEQASALARASLARFAEAPTPANLNLLFHKSYSISPAGLRRSILMMAVQGKLLPQDPKDEPADKFLAAILKSLNKNNNRRSSGNADEGGDSNKPFALPNGWSWARFSELGEFGRGKSKHRPRNDHSLFAGGKHRLVQTGDVSRANGTIETHTGLYNDVGLAQSKMWPAGTLCITIAANIADSGILGFDACFPDSVVGFVPAKPIPSARYFEYFMRTAKEDLNKFAPATAQKNINLGILEQVWIPIPPLAEQRRIVAKVDQLMALVDQLETQLAASRATARNLLEAVVAEFSDGQPIAQ
ncbi:MAG: hypothetical protein RLZZ398_1980 [Verrucomicrobiota bacterium]